MGTIQHLDLQGH